MRFYSYFIFLRLRRQTSKAKVSSLAVTITCDNTRIIASTLPTRPLISPGALVTLLTTGTEHYIRTVPNINLVWYFPNCVAPDFKQNVYCCALMKITVVQLCFFFFFYLNLILTFPFQIIFQILIIIITSMFWYSGDGFVKISSQLDIYYDVVKHPRGIRKWNKRRTRILENSIQTAITEKFKNKINSNILWTCNLINVHIKISIRYEIFLFVSFEYDRGVKASPR